MDGTRRLKIPEVEEIKEKMGGKSQDRQKVCSGRVDGNTRPKKKIQCAEIELFRNIEGRRRLVK